jgi:predicted enzyme related to lactoylglutathione lyase
MTERDSHPAGTPSWIDLGSPDPDASAAFYSALFGWDIGEAGGPETGGYRMATLKGRPVAGIGASQSEGAPPWWTTYVTVDDADATAKVVDQAGGTVVVPPMDVMEFGRMAVFTDPGGATFSVWQPKQHHGSGLVDEPGTLTWNELMVRDLDKAKPFYQKVFGWGTNETDMGGFAYTTWQLDGKSVGGAMPMVGDMWPADLPDHWMVYFDVANCDESVAKAKELGATVSVQPTDIPGVGRFSVLTGPQGEVFSMLQGPDTDSTT